ncbi:MAG: hypothetical protein ABJC10_12035 [Acidobacteriota bacterium]
MPALHRTKGSLGRFGLILVFGCLFCATADAYSVVMHGGRRIEIPSLFVVTASTLTYEVSPGIQITLNLSAIDIPATEKLNNEAPGSLLRHAPSSANEEVAPVQAAQRLTITNRDLAASMRRRRDSELAYERRRKELGLPSVEESRRQADAESALIESELKQTVAAERESESYWRARASALRTEIAALDSQISYVRSQLDEPLYAGSNDTFRNFGILAPIVSFGNGGRRGSFSPPVNHPSVFGAPRSAQLSGRMNFGGGATRGRVFVNPAWFPRSHGFGVPVFGSSNVFVPTLQPYVYDERNQLITQFNELAAARAGLNARWRELQDEARRAGASPGWLRP